MTEPESTFHLLNCKIPAQVEEMIYMMRRIRAIKAVVLFKLLSEAKSLSSL